MEVDGSHVGMMGGRVVFREIVSQILFSGTPVYVKLTFLYPILEPVEAQVNGFGSFLFDGVCEDSLACGIVSLEWCGRLWVSQFFQGCSEWACILGIVKGCADFGFSSGGEDIAHDSDQNVDGGIDERRVKLGISQEVIASCS